ncbi:hypothetical protein [Myceligenerans halotolerans]
MNTQARPLVTLAIAALLATATAGCGYSSQAKSKSIHEHFDGMDGVVKVDVQSHEPLPGVGGVGATIHLERDLPLADVENILDDASLFLAFIESSEGAVVADGIQIETTTDLDARDVAMSWFEVLRDEPTAESAHIVADGPDLEVQTLTSADLAATYVALRDGCSGRPCDDVALNVTQRGTSPLEEEESLFVSDAVGVDRSPSAQPADGGAGPSTHPRGDATTAVEAYRNISAATPVAAAHLTPGFAKIAVAPYDDFLTARAKARELSAEYHAPSILVTGGGIVTGEVGPFDVGRMDAVVDALLAERTVTTISLGDPVTIDVPDVDAMADVARALEEASLDDAWIEFELRAGPVTARATAEDLGEMITIARAADAPMTLTVNGVNLLRQPRLHARIEIGTPDDAADLVHDLRPLVSDGDTIELVTREELTDTQVEVSFDAHHERAIWVQGSEEELLPEAEAVEDQLVTAIEEGWNS